MQRAYNFTALCFTKLFDEYACFPRYSISVSSIDKLFYAYFAEIPARKRCHFWPISGIDSDCLIKVFMKALKDQTFTDTFGYNIKIMVYNFTHSDRCVLERIINIYDDKVV